MSLPSREILLRLGARERIEDVCAAAGLTRAQFDSWWNEVCRKRVPKLPPPAGIQIDRDRRGIPHVKAANDLAAFLGWGFATAQDRLFQLEFARRKALGRLAEVLGPDGLESDKLYRTLGVRQLAEAEWETLSDDMQLLLRAYSDGINVIMQATRECPPIEFDLLDYRPDPWRPTDSLAILLDFRWYLTGRFPVILIPELVRRAVGPGEAFRAFVSGEDDEESILQRGEYTSQPHHEYHPGVGDEAGGGSNNWVLSGGRTANGKPLVASDPHIPFQAVSIWHEVCVRGEAYRVAGAALAGVPGVMIGRNERMAWGVTNNICSLRDLYQERTHPDHPGCFEFDGTWEAARLRDEGIGVRGQARFRHQVISSRNGPIVDEFLPAAARQLGPISLRWVGFEPCGWLTATLAMNRAKNCIEFREAGRPWAAPTFNLVFADVDGHIGFQTVGRIPIRLVPERGLRPGWDAHHQWAGCIPYDELPHLLNPKRGYVVTANNRLAPDDYPYLLFGCWSSGYRARCIREQIERKAKWSNDDCRQLQLDVTSKRAAIGVPPLLAAFADTSDARVRAAVMQLKNWDSQIRTDSSPAAIFNAFFARWCKTVMRERLPVDIADFTAANANGLALRLLCRDSFGWFQRDRLTAIRETFVATLDELESRLGPVISEWTWGKLHCLVQKHFLSGRGDLGKLLDLPIRPAPGDGTTVCSGTPDANHAAWLGAGYRMVVDLADPEMKIWSIEVSGTSGHPGSPHYDDQFQSWAAGELLPVRLK